MFLRLLAFIIIGLYVNATNAYAQYNSAPKTSPFKGGMNSLSMSGKSQIKKSPYTLNSITPAAGQATNKKSKTLSAVEERVWAKYKALTNGALEQLEQKSHISFKSRKTQIPKAPAKSTPQQAAQSVLKQQVLLQKKIQEKVQEQSVQTGAGVASLIQNYEKRKAARGRVQSVTLND